MTKRTFIHWIIFLIIVALWVLCLPLLCRAEVRQWTPDDKSMLAWGALGVAADIYTTTQFLNNPNNYETNPLLGRHPKPLTVVSYIVTEYLISVAIAHFCPDLTLPIIGKVNMRHQILYNRASQYTANACWNTRLDWSN